jgi:hypothetical protein
VIQQQLAEAGQQHSQHHHQLYHQLAPTAQKKHISVAASTLVALLASVTPSSQEVCGKGTAPEPFMCICCRRIIGFKALCKLNTQDKQHAAGGNWALVLEYAKVKPAA